MQAVVHWPWAHQNWRSAAIRHEGVVRPVEARPHGREVGFERRMGWRRRVPFPGHRPHLTLALTDDPN